MCWTSAALILVICCVSTVVLFFPLFLLYCRPPRVMQLFHLRDIPAQPTIHLVSIHSGQLYVIWTRTSGSGANYFFHLTTLAVNSQTIQFRPTVVLPYGQGIGIPYGYPTGFVSGLPIDQSFRSTYPFLMPGQYVTQMPYTQQQVCVCVCVCVCIITITTTLLITFILPAMLAGCPQTKRA